MCDRDLGIFIDTEKGSGQDNRCVYLKADTGTYEFFRNSAKQILEDNIEDIKVGDEIKVGVKTKTQELAEVEKRLVIHLNNKFKITMSFHHKKCGIMLQGKDNSMH